jgi:hypothetical protein
VRLELEKTSLGLVFAALTVVFQTAAFAQIDAPAKVSDSNLSALSNAERGDVYLITPPAANIPRDLSHSQTVHLRALSAHELPDVRERIQSVIRSAGSGPQSSCRFVPDFAIAFTASAETVWWIMDSSCSHSGMLVTKSEDWRKSLPLLVPKNVAKGLLALRGK